MTDEHVLSKKTKMVPCTSKKNKKKIFKLMSSRPWEKKRLKTHSEWLWLTFAIYSQCRVTNSLFQRVWKQPALTIALKGRVLSATRATPGAAVGLWPPGSASRDEEAGCRLAARPSARTQAPEAHGGEDGEGFSSVSRHPKKSMIKDAWVRDRLEVRTCLASQWLREALMNLLF